MTPLAPIRKLPVENTTPLCACAFVTEALGENPILALVVKGTYELVEGRGATPAREPIAVAERDTYTLAHPDRPSSVRLESDLVPFKPRADVVLVGHARAPAAEPVTSLEVSIRVGDAPAHRILVFGDRVWTAAPGGDGLAPSAAEPFLEMPLTYERAFGGLDLDEAHRGEWSDANPVGRGLVAVERIAGVEGRRLPNLEDPAALVRSPRDRPFPAGTGFFGRGWKPRVSSMGTFDEAWRRDRSPRMPLDFRSDHFNAAHPALQRESFLRAGEEVELRNVHHALPRITFLLPQVELFGVAVFTVKVVREGKLVSRERVAAIPLNLDTLCILPDEDRFFLLWRGAVALHVEAEPVRCGLSLVGKSRAG
jgi:hypothetical protein